MFDKPTMLPEFISALFYLLFSNICAAVRWSCLFFSGMTKGVRLPFLAAGRLGSLHCAEVPVHYSVE